MRPPFAIRHARYHTPFGLSWVARASGTYGKESDFYWIFQGYGPREFFRPRRARCQSRGTVGAFYWCAFATRSRVKRYYRTRSGSSLARRLGPAGNGERGLPGGRPDRGNRSSPVTAYRHSVDRANGPSRLRIPIPRYRHGVSGAPYLRSVRTIGPFRIPSEAECPSVSVNVVCYFTIFLFFSINT